MPSVAKKRKIAKKKKEMEARNNKNSSTVSHGDDDLKGHDHKESHGGEVSSHASPKHHHQRHPCTTVEEEEMEKREDSSSVRSIVTESKSIEGFSSNRESKHKVGLDESGLIQIDRDIKREDDSYSKNFGLNYVGSVNESHGGGMSLDGTSSSSNCSSSDDESHIVDKNKVVVESRNLEVEAPDLFIGSSASDNSAKSANLPEVTQVVETDGWIAEITPLVDSENASKEVVRINDSSSAENALHSNVWFKENGKTASSGFSPVEMDKKSHVKEDKVVSTASEVPAVESNNSAEHIKVSTTSGEADSQPLVPSAPQPLQTTSWKSCCGLFEVFTGSDR